MDAPLVTLPEPVWTPLWLFLLVVVVFFGFLEYLLRFDDEGYKRKGFTQTHVVRQNATSWVLGLTPKQPRQALALVWKETEK